MPARNTRHGVTDVKVPGMNAKKNMTFHILFCGKT